jgi:TonB family protein
VTVLLTLALAAGLQLAPPSTTVDEPITRPTIVYPADAKKARIEGSVQLQIHVDPTGHVTAVQALDGPVALRQAAIDAYTHAAYKPLLTNGKPAPAVITTSVAFHLQELPPDTDQKLAAAFAPLHVACQNDYATKSPDAVASCQQALDMANRFSPTFLPNEHATAYNDLVLALIAVKGNAQALRLGDQAVDFFLDPNPARTHHSPAAATAYITRAEIRYTVDNYKGTEADCIATEEIVRTLLQDESEVDKSANYRQQLRETMLLHAAAEDHMHRPDKAKKLREQAKYI